MPGNTVPMKLCGRLWCVPLIAFEWLRLAQLQDVVFPANCTTHPMNISHPVKPHVALLHCFCLFIFFLFMYCIFAAV